MVKSVYKLLTKAKQIIANPDNWAQYSFSRDSNNDRCNLEHGTKFCALGALHKAEGTLPNQKITTLFSKAFNLLDDCARSWAFGSYRGIVDANDYGSHMRVMKAFECAIQKTKEEKKKRTSNG